MSDIQIKYTQQGWECPKCGRVYSPYTIMCQFCGAEEITRTYTNPTSNPTSNPTLEGKNISFVSLDEEKLFKTTEDKNE